MAKGAAPASQPTPAATSGAVQPGIVLPEPAIAEIDDGAKVKPVPPKKWAASIFPKNKQPLPECAAAHVLELQESLGMPIWLLLQGEPRIDRGFGTITPSVLDAFIRSHHVLPEGQPVALLIDSYGGNAESAYLMARLLTRRCGSFIAIVPRRAKSAATLLCLGAHEILFGMCGELGPLDTQLYDEDDNRWVSALEEVESLSRLNAFGIDAFNAAIISMMSGLGDDLTPKKLKALLPPAMSYASGMTRPLLEKIDVLRYTSKARAMKVGRLYAERLLRERYDGRTATRIAGRLANEYPDHSFVIDYGEATAPLQHNFGLGLQGRELGADENRIIDSLFAALAAAAMPTVIGRIEEVAGDGDQEGLKGE